MSTEIRSTTTVEPGHDKEVELILNQIGRFFQIFKRAGSRFVSHQQDGIEQSAYAILFMLVSEGPLRTTALAEAVHLDTSTVSRQVGSLVRHGLVERQADPVDGRASLLAATASGKERFDQHKQARACELQSMLAHWSVTDLRAFVDMFERLNNELEHYEHQHSHVTNPGYVKGGTR